MLSPELVTEFMIVVAVPAATSLLLLHIRHRYKVEWFVASSILLLCFTLTIWLRIGMIPWYYQGSRPGRSGFDSGSLPVAMACIIVVCIPRFKSRWIRGVQVGISVAVQFVLVGIASWIA